MEEGSFAERMKVSCMPARPEMLGRGTTPEPLYGKYRKMPWRWRKKLRLHLVNSNQIWVVFMSGKEIRFLGLNHWVGRWFRKHWHRWTPLSTWSYTVPCEDMLVSSRWTNSITRSNIPTSGQLFPSEQLAFLTNKVFPHCCLAQGSEDAQDIPLSLPRAARQSKTSCMDYCEEITSSVHALTQEVSRHTWEWWEAVLPLESHGIILPAGCCLHSPGTSPIWCDHQTVVFRQSRT